MEITPSRFRGLFYLKRNERIDKYWSLIFALQNSSSFQYPTLIIVVQAALSLTHGSTDVEGEFSESGRILTEEDLI